MGILSDVLGGGGAGSLLSAGAGIIGGLFQRGAVKKAGATLANQFGQNSQMILDRGDKEASNLGLTGEHVAQDIEGAAGEGGQKIADATNTGVTRIDDALGGLRPYMGVGQQGIDAVTKGFNDDDSGLAWLQNKGKSAVNNNAAFNGLIGGNDAKALNDYAQGTAQQYRSSWLNDQLKLIGVGQDAQGQNIAGQKSVADLLGSGARDVANLQYKGATDAGDTRYGSVSDAAKVRIGATGDAVDQLTGGAQATAASQIGSASALSNVLNSAGKGAGVIANGIGSWLQNRGSSTALPALRPQVAALQPQLLPAYAG